LAAYFIGVHALLLSVIKHSSFHGLYNI